MESGLSRDTQLDAQMRGKRILFIGVNDDRKDFILEMVVSLGFEVYAVGTRPQYQMVNKVQKYVEYDSSDKSKEAHHSEVIVKRVNAEIVDVDGCICLWDAEIPLAALVTARLGKPGISYAGALAAMSKTQTMEALTSSDLGNGRRNSNTVGVVKYASRCSTIESAADVKKCVEKIGLPAILKTEFGAAGMGVKLVHSLQEAVDHFNHIQVLHDEHKDRSYILGGTYKRSCVLMEYLEGSEHCVDLALFHGEVVCAFVCDKGPQIPPDVFKTVITMPSLMPKDKLKSVITAAIDCCKSLGFDHGVFDVEIMLTKSGPKMIAINPRVGGFCLRDFILQCYNVDLVHLACLIACDINPHVSVPEGGEKSAGVPSQLPFRHAEIVISESDVKPGPLCSMVGMYIYAWRHRKALKTTATPEILERLHDNGDLFFIRHEFQMREYDHEIPWRSRRSRSGKLGIR
ncbi:hypothetical protein BaRGS_00008968 [Batillaria attramentaria]|uniref:ATP-grasp domain-containing protein n=1 Tax=Batillaria attramentaria TaxID=370345 RepID=A0ABD0LK07_9CAEN